MNTGEKAEEGEEEAEKGVIIWNNLLESIYTKPLS
jgi:hypothetical protein